VVLFSSELLIDELTGGMSVADLLESEETLFEAIRFGLVRGSPKSESSLPIRGVNFRICCIPESAVSYQRAGVSLRYAVNIGGFINNKSISFCSTEFGCGPACGFY